MCLQLVDGLLVLRYQASRDSKQYELVGENEMDKYSEDNTNMYVRMGKKIQSQQSSAVSNPTNDLISSSAATSYASLNQKLNSQMLSAFQSNTDRLSLPPHEQRKFNDNRWHLVLIERFGQTVKLAIDKGYSPSSIDWKENMATISRRNQKVLKPQTNLYFGGLPKTMRYKNLAMPSVYYAIRFRGDIEKVKINNQLLKVLKSEDIVPEESLLCTYRNPCQNGGRCRIVNKEQRCDCLDVFVGDFCEHRKYLSFGVIASSLPLRNLNSS